MDVIVLPKNAVILKEIVIFHFSDFQRMKKGTCIYNTTFFGSFFMLLIIIFPYEYVSFKLYEQKFYVY